MFYTIELSKAQLDAVAEAVKVQEAESERLGSPDTANWWNDLWQMIHEQAAENESR